jgi:preprotein translocase subunit SecG
MTLLINILLGIYVFDALLMMLVILMQRPKSEGLGAAFGGGVTENIFGAQTTNVLTKITGWLAAIFFLLTFILSILYAHKANRSSNLSRELTKGQTPAPAASATPVPGASGTPVPGASASGTPAPVVTATASPSGSASAAPSASVTGTMTPPASPAASAAVSVAPATTPAAPAAPSVASVKIRASSPLPAVSASPKP